MDNAGMMSGQGIGEEPKGTFGKAFLEAAKFWERWRVVYNLVLIAVVVAWVVFSWPHFRPMFRWQGLLFLMVMALIANACYCAAYVVEFAMLSSPVQSAWKRGRWILWVVGALLAVVLANYWIVDEIYPFVQ